MHIKPLTTGVLAAAALITALSVSAREVTEQDFSMHTTKELYDLCASTPDDPNFVAALYACRGFIEGAVQYHDGVSDRKHLKRLICYPDTAVLEDGRQVFVAWARAHASDTNLMNELSVIGLVRALSEEFACSR